jgi:DNA topoisomerase IB
MANKEIDSSNQIILVDSDACDAIAYDTYHTWYGNGFSDEVAREKALAAKKDCEALQKKKTPSIENFN